MTVPQHCFGKPSSPIQSLAQVQYFRRCSAPTPLLFGSQSTWCHPLVAALRSLPPPFGDFSIPKSELSLVPFRFAFSPEFSLYARPCVSLPNISPSTAQHSHVRMLYYRSAQVHQLIYHSNLTSLGYLGDVWTSTAQPSRLHRRRLPCLPALDCIVHYHSLEINLKPASYI